jgi:ribonuclease J
VLDAKGRLATLPSVLAEGMPEPVAEAVRRAVEDRVREAGGRRNDPDGLAQDVRRIARRAAQDAWGKKPVTRVMVSEL